MTEDCLMLYGEKARPKGIVEASLRASYASSFFEETNDLSLTAWRLRVKDLSTLRHYVQELQSQSFVARQSLDAKERIRLFSSLGPVVIPAAIRLLKARVNPGLWPTLWSSGKSW